MTLTQANTALDLAAALPGFFGAHIKSLLRFALAVGFIFGGVEVCDAITVTVAGSANPWLAGMPAGTTDPPDVAPSQSPAQVPGLRLTQGQALSFSVTGAVANCFAGPGTSCCPTCGIAFPSPDGAPPGQQGAEFFQHRSTNGISDVVAPINSLIGVFLGPNQPSLGAAPPTLNFSSIGLGFSSLSPQLQQTFFIGDDLTGTASGNVQRFIVPSGATRLFLGTMDGGEWNNNSGAFGVSMVPEPAEALFLALGLIVLLVRSELTLSNHKTQNRRRTPNCHVRPQSS